MFKPVSRARKFVGLTILILLISLIAFAMFFPPGISRRSSQHSKAKAAIHELSEAIASFCNEQNCLPLSEGEGETKIVLTDERLMNVISACDQPDESPYKIGHFTYRKAKGKNGDYWDGLHQTRSTFEFFGPWRNPNIEDRYYRVIFNYGYKDAIKVSDELGGELVKGEMFLIYHKGPDGKTGPGFNEDNVYSWK